MARANQFLLDNFIEEIPIVEYNGFVIDFIRAANDRSKHKVRNAMPRPHRLSLELLETFVVLSENDGDASRAAEQLGVNQPSMSKRLAVLRHATRERVGQPWLVRNGKRWRLTPEGQRVRVLVTDMVRRYEQLERFVASGAEGKPAISIACGQQAANSFVGAAVEQLLREGPPCRVRLSTPRGKARIEGVAGGQFDLAIVTDSPAAVRKIARREMFIQAIQQDSFVLAANPAPRSAWGSAWSQLPADVPVAAADLLELPLILPEPDASRRRQFENWCYRATGRTPEVVLEAGGWQTILDFASAGSGVGLVPMSSVDQFRNRSRRKLTLRQLDSQEFPPDPVYLITRKTHGKEEADLTESGTHLLNLLLNQVHNQTAADHASTKD
jgi:LysR family positive regulator for ilvC